MPPHGKQSKMGDVQDASPRTTQSPPTKKARLSDSDSKVSFLKCFTQKAPQEIVDKVWLEVLDSMLGVDDDQEAGGANFIKLEVDDDGLHTEEYEGDDSSAVVLNEVRPGGYGKMFGSELSTNVPEFSNFLGSVTRCILFRFRDSSTLEDFCELYTKALLEEDRGSATLKVEIFVFADSKSFAGLDRWKKLSGAHGYQQGAEKHFRGWMEAVQMLPRDARVRMTICHPWRDYRALRGITAPLRDMSMVVCVDEKKWRNIPDSRLHLGMTAASIMDVYIPEQDDLEEEQETLVEFGCRGFHKR